MSSTREPSLLSPVPSSFSPDQTLVRSETRQSDSTCTKTSSKDDPSPLQPKSRTSTRYIRVTSSLPLSSPTRADLVLGVDDIQDSVVIIDGLTKVRITFRYQSLPLPPHSLVPEPRRSSRSPTGLPPPRLASLLDRRTQGSHQCGESVGLLPRWRSEPSVTGRCSGATRAGESSTRYCAFRFSSALSFRGRTQVPN